MRLTNDFELPRDVQLFAPGWNLHRDSEPAAVCICEADAAKINRDLSKWNALALQGVCDRPFIDFSHRASLMKVSPAEPAALVEAAYWGGDDARDGGVRLLLTWNSKLEAHIKRQIREGKIRCLSSIARLGELDGIVTTFQGVNPNVAGLVAASALCRTAPIVPEISGYEESSDERDIYELLARKKEEAEYLVIEREGFRMKFPKPETKLALLCRRMSDAIAINAREMATDLPAEKGMAGRIMFAPAGEHEICPSLGDVASAVVTIRVDRSTAGVLNQSLAKLNAEIAPQRICFDADHKGEAAMAWPISFHWEDNPRPGVYAVVEYSKLGREFVDGKVYRAFSGSFYTDAELPKRKDVKPGKVYEVAAGKRGSPDNPAGITGLAAPFAGTLTNNPAFTQIAPIWASKALAPLGSLRSVNSQLAQANREATLLRRQNTLLLERQNQLLTQLLRK